MVIYRENLNVERELENIISFLYEEFEKIGIVDSSEVQIVTDSGRNIVVEVSDMRSNRCMAHRLHTVLSDALEYAKEQNPEILNQDIFCRKLVLKRKFSPRTQVLVEIRREGIELFKSNFVTMLCTKFFSSLNPIHSIALLLDILLKDFTLIEDEAERCKQIAQEKVIYDLFIIFALIVINHCL